MPKSPQVFLPEPVLYTGLFIAHHAAYIPRGYKYAVEFVWDYAETL